ncbi:MAG: hypothetical protein L6R43_07355 [Planctomycetes bacterium]|nr:hypothetical protein [Planctomycetota bacterium]
MAEPAHIDRHPEPRIEEAFADTPVVLLHGPRQCGKTTFARRLGERAGSAFVTLEDEVHLKSAPSAVLYDGEAGIAFGDRLRAVPMRVLWEA